MTSRTILGLIHLCGSKGEPRGDRRHHHHRSTTMDEDAAPGSELYDLVLEMRWYWALKHVVKRPQDAAWLDGDTLESPLHLACQNQPPARLVKALLRAYPDAARARSYKHRVLPLHIACRYNASLEVLRELLVLHPDTATCVDKYENTPFHSLLQGRDTISDASEAENYSTVFWQKVELLLHGVARARGSEGLLLHAAVSVGSLRCPEPVLDFCLDRHAAAVRRRDATDQLPLHLAVGRGPGAARRRYRPRERHALRRLLQMYPEAALQRDPTEPEGRLPLHTALVNGHVWHGGIKELFEAGPEAAITPDPLTKLYACQLSSDCDTIFRLLRSYPCVLATRGVRHRRDTDGDDDIGEVENGSNLPTTSFLVAFTLGTVLGIICHLPGLPFVVTD